MDEAFLTLNLITRSFASLFGELSFNQAAPAGFLLVERMDIMLLGEGEFALRVFPLICGIASIFLFKRLANLVLSPGAALLALALFSVSDGLIYYSSEVKQYSTDVAATLLIALAGVELQTRQLPRRRLLVWGVAVLIAVWFSHAAAFMIVAVLAVLVVPDLLGRRRKRVRAAAAVFGPAVIGLAGALAYVATTASHLLSTYRGGTSPENVFPTGLGFFRNAAGGLINALGVPATGPEHYVRFAIGIVAVAGAVALARRNRAALALILVAAAAVVAAAGIQAYPVLTRTILFLLPFVILLVSEGVVALGSLFRDRAVLATAVLALAVLAIPAKNAGEHLVNPRQREEMKPVLRYLVDEWHPGDALYVFYRAQYAFRYYLECNCFAPWEDSPAPWTIAAPSRPGPQQYARALLSSPPDIVIAEPHARLEEYFESMASLRGRKRVWLLVTMPDPIEAALLDLLSCGGRRTDAYVRDDGEGLFHSVAVYRYDLSGWRSLLPDSCRRHVARR
jgi:hypothetical protein